MTAPTRTFSILLCIAVLLVLFAPIAHAQNSLGVGNSEQAIKPEGIFAPILFWIQQEQKSFYQSLTNALKTIRSGQGGFWLLVSLSFSYGVLHAAGPGHGKAVISSYMLANEVQLRRGIVLSFASAALQAIVAIVGIGALIFFLRGLGLKQAVFTHWLEVASYVGVTLLGLWLLLKKVRPRKVAMALHDHPAHSDQHNHEDHAHDHSCGHSNVPHHDHKHDHKHGRGHDHKHGAGDVCSECGHLHAPDPAMLAGKFGVKEAWSAIFAVGLRPCTGAMIVLTFAFLNGLYWAGIASAFAMALGTGITVAVIASIAVGAKNLALHISGASEASAGFYYWIEFAGALFVFLLGATLLSATLY